MGLGNAAIVNKRNRDYIGQEGEQEDFEAAWCFLKEIVVIMPVFNIFE